MGPISKAGKANQGQALQLIRPIHK